ncbi:MAG: thioredoxin domain-containing protein [Candidatus Poribacteria bacterium]|nr:thioredoxin domain-containing protein [Candidatus Poribacteria bacterium]
MNQKRKRRPRHAGTQQASQVGKKQRRQLKRQEEAQQLQLAEIQLAQKRRLIKRVAGWSGLVAGLALLVFALIYFTNGPEPETATQLTDHPEPEATTQLTDQIPALGWTLGNPDAPITLVEYSDYQCPLCAKYHHIIKRLVEELGDDFHLVFRHYPLQQNHANATLAASSAEAAGRQGKFWEMHHLLFVGQEEWSGKERAEAKEMFLHYAVSLNLDVDQFQRDLHSQAVLKKITNDSQTGRNSGVTGTPAFFLNGQKVTNKPRTYEAFKAFILQSKNKLP